MPKTKSNHELGVTFVSATRESSGARTPEGGKRWFPGESFIAALNRNGVPATSLMMTTRMASTRNYAPGYRRTRGIPVSLGFLVELARSPTPFVACREYGLETLLTLIVARLCGRRTLVFQEHVGRSGERLSFVDTQYRRGVGRLVTAFIANTPAARDEIVRLLRVDPARVFQIMAVVPPDRAELCLEPVHVGRPRTRPLFLNMGRLIVGKNVEAILRAARLLQEQGLAFEVWIAGEGPDEGRLRRIAAELDVDETVRFIGPIPHPSTGFVYDACDVFVQPSHADLVSVAVLEAMRFGKALICSARVGAVGLVAHDQINALVFDPAEPSQLADRMRQFIVDPQLAVKMGSQSESIMENQTKDSVAVALIDVLKRIASAED